MFLSINNQPGGIINVFKDSTVTIHQSGGQQTMQVQKNDCIHAEDIQAEEVKPDKQDYFPLLTEQCRKEGKIEKVEAELSTACKGSAAWLWSVIHTNEALGYIATNHLDAQDVYNAFTDYFGELPYNVRNFRGARNKK